MDNKEAELLKRINSMESSLKEKMEYCRMLRGDKLGAAEIFE